MTPSERDRHYRIQRGHPAWTITMRRPWPHIDRTGYRGTGDQLVSVLTRVAAVTVQT